MPTDLTTLANGLGKAIEIAPDIYTDGLKPTTQESGKTLALIPRTINAALAPLRQWIAQKEYNVAETEKLLSQKLENINPENIVTPEAYVAVPAFQAIAYCMSNKELYDLYANLLAKAMNIDFKLDVHPAFVEIIKQLSPNDALVLREIALSKPLIEATTFTIVMKPKGMYMLGSPQPIKCSNECVYNLHCNNLSEDQLSLSINNLERLGIIIMYEKYIPSDANYEFAKTTQLYKKIQDFYDSLKGTDDEPERIAMNQKYFTLSPLGDSFCKICVCGI